MSSRSELLYTTSQWENEGGATRFPKGEPENSQNLAAHGITAVQLTAYEWSGYRYTNVKNAIAAAERNIR